MDKKIVVDEQKSALPGWICVQDADDKSAANMVLFTDEQIEQTHDIAERAADIYTFKGLYVNFRKNLAVIKLDRVYGEPNVKAAIALKEYAEALGFEKIWIKGTHSIRFTARRYEKVELE